MVELLIRWGFTVLSNFTVGMFSAVINFAFALPSMIATFASTDWVSALAFFLVAVVAASSVAASLLLLLFGTAGGVVYGAVAAGPALARLEASGRERERIRMIAQQRRRGMSGAAAHHREHAD